MEKKATLTVGADCHLEGASRQVVEELKGQLTLENPKYKDAQKYGRWVGKRLKPFLHFYVQNAGGLRFPRGFVNHCVRLSRRHMGPEALVIRDQRTTLSPVALQFKGDLRPYQKEAVSAILRHEFGVIESGTGSGKTVIALAVIAKRRQPTLVLVHTKELLYQWAERVHTFLGIDAGLIGDGHYELQPVTIAIVNTARNRLGELPHHFGQICVDECHRVPASLFTDVVKAFACRFSLGLSATAFRRDGLTKLIYLFLGDRSHRVDPHELQSSGAVLKPEFIQRPTGFTYFYRGNYHDLLSALTMDEARNRQIAADIRQEARNNTGTILVVSDRVAHCETLAELLADQDLRVAVLTGKMPADDRAQLVAAIRNGEINVLISTVQLIGEGFDCPELQTLFLTTPIKFTGRLLQVVGRILRPSAGKKPKVYDYIDPVGALQASARSRWQTFNVE